MYWVVFVIGAALSWGAYGPTLHAGQMQFADATPALKSLRAFLCVGIAYFLVAVLVPAAMLGSQGQLASGFTVKGAAFALFAGALGAIGALCITWAFRNGGSPLVVMPLVFCGAPVVNAAISTLSHPPAGGLSAIKLPFYLGLALVAGGAFLVLWYKPH